MYPTSAFGVAASIRVAAMLNFSTRQRCELEQHLHLLVRKASLRIDAALPLTTSSVYTEALDLRIVEDQYDAETDVHCTEGRAHYDAYDSGYFTYIKIPDELS